MIYIKMDTRVLCSMQKNYNTKATFIYHLKSSVNNNHYR